ncbi:MAG: hypothetical protein IPJ06_06015 [Saprospiraceae bacterium]|nr:hypothetical protein [Saprospiraceae bacterium]
MSTNNKLGRILFVILGMPVTLFIGMAFASLSGAAANQGLAGGAIVFGYGVIFAAVGLVLSLLFIRRIPLVAIVGIAVFAWFRIEAKQKAKAEEAIERQAVPMHLKTEQQVDGPMGLGCFQLHTFDQPVLYVYGPPQTGMSILQLPAQDSIVFGKTEYGGSDILSAPPWLVPFHMKLDYDIFYLKIIGLTREMVECEVNSMNGETRYFDRRAGEVIYWADFLLGVHSVEWPDDQPGIVRIKPLSQASQVMVDYVFMHPIMIRGHWMLVELWNDDFEQVGNGWIRWTDGEKLLVRYSLLS